MNTRLELLFEKHNVSQKNRYEINQFFCLLPDVKKNNILNNFEILAVKLTKISEDLKLEREILLPKSIERIKGVLNKVRDERINIKNKNKNEWSITRIFWR